MKFNIFDGQDVQRAFSQNGFADSRSAIIRPYRAEEAMEKSVTVKNIGLLAISLKARHPNLCVKPEERESLEEIMRIDETTRRHMWEQLEYSGQVSLNQLADIEAMARRREEIHDDPSQYYLNPHRDAYGI